MRNILGSVAFPNSQTLEELTHQIQLLLPEFTFHESHRYDEVPAYEAEREGMSVVLCGLPEGELGEYTLEFFCATGNPVGSGFLADLFKLNKAAGPNGYTYYSRELANALAERGVIGAVPVGPDV